MVIVTVVTKLPRAADGQADKLRLEANLLE